MSRGEGRGTNPNSHDASAGRQMVNTTPPDATLTGEALDDATIADQRWMDGHGTDTRARHSYPCEVEALGETYRDGYYGTRVQRIDRDTHAKAIFAADHGQWLLLAIGGAIYPPGGIDALARGESA